MNTENTTTHNAKTKKDADAKGSEVTTALTIDWSNITQDDLRALAARTIIIAWQSNMRRSSEAIPETATIDAADAANPKRKPRDPLSAARSALSSMTPEERAAFIASL